MENNKLGIEIISTKANNKTSGLRVIYRFNDKDWSSVVRDTKADLKKVTNNPASDPIHFVQFTSNGYCYCIMQPIAGRKDYLSAWLFIHKDINLPKGILSSIIKRIEEVLSHDIDAEREKELDSLFNQTYPTTTKSPCFSVSSGDSYAVRYYGDGTMYDYKNVLEDYLYQPEYCKYKSVFLVNKSKGQTITDVTDLSDTKLQKSKVIDLPKEINGFKPYNSDGVVISNAIRITEEGTKIVWKRIEYKTIEKCGSTKESLMIQESECYKLFSCESFYVVDKKTGKILNKARLNFRGDYMVDDKNNPQKFYFKEEDLSKIYCCVDLDGYQSFKDYIDLTKPNRETGNFKIELQPEEHIYKFRIKTEIPDNKEIEFTICTQFKLNGSEIPGFKFKEDSSENGINILEADSQQVSTQHSGNTPNGRNTTKGGNTGNNPKGEGQKYGGASDKIKDGTYRKFFRKISTFLTEKHTIFMWVIVVIVVIGGIFYLLKGSDTPNTPVKIDYPKSNGQGDVSIPSHPGQTQQTQQNSEWEKAFAYLSEHNTSWVKSKMDSFTELEGVYTMIKDYDFEALKSFIEEHEDLRKLDSWNRLYEDIASKYNNKKGSFNAPNDSIDIEQYLNTDFEKMEDVSTSSSATTSQGGNTTSQTNNTQRETGTTTNTTNQDEMN